MIHAPPDRMIVSTMTENNLFLRQTKARFHRLRVKLLKAGLNVSSIKERVKLFQQMTYGIYVNKSIMCSTILRVKDKTVIKESQRKNAYNSYYINCAHIIFCCLNAIIM